MLVNDQWPGNVRELRNVLERAVIFSDCGLITGEHLALTVFARQTTAPALRPPVAPSTESATALCAGDLESMERTMIEQALRAAQFNKSKAAKALGLTRHKLYIRMRRYGVQ